jgi:hypothetical protein
VERPRPATGHGRGDARNRMLARLPKPTLVFTRKVLPPSVLSRGPCPLPAEGEMRVLEG